MGHRTNDFPLSILENLNQITENFSVTGTNSTSGNKISKTNDDIKLVALAKSGVTLEVPKRSCAQGHSLILQIQADVTQADGTALHYQTQVTGVIEEIEGDLQERFQVRLEFRQYSVDDWQKFLGHVEKRQENINLALGVLKK